MEISEDKLQELTESHYLRGQRSALIKQLHNVLLSLSIDYKNVDAAPENLMTIARLTTEREETISALRSVCEEHGDNDWDEDLYLADVVNKHLGDYLNESAIPNGWIYEDQLSCVSQEEYDQWFKLSRVISGVRMGPPLNVLNKTT